MQRVVPAHRANLVGSPLRTSALKQAHGKLATGPLSAAEFAAIKNAEIKSIIAGF